MNYFYLKITFLQLKRYIHRVYLTLLSTTCVKIQQIPQVVFETISHFSSVFFAQTLHTFTKSSPTKCKFSDFPLLALKFIKLLMSFFKQKVSFSSKFGSLFSVTRDNFSVLFWLKLYMLLTKIAHQSENF